VTVASVVLPRAYAALPIEGMTRCCPEDFVVEERAQHPVADGEHLLLWIEKRGLNSHQVATDLARLFVVPDVDVSFAGMKDRHAVTRQWFSVRTPRTVDALDGAAGLWRVLGSQRGQRKLRRGDLEGNAFVIRIRGVSGDSATVTERLERLRDFGVPNYFGEQRFGHGGANIERARAWVCNRPRPVVSPFQKGLHLSTARALLFNAVLARRVRDGSWNMLLDGDVADSGVPTGPLWGRGRLATSGSAALCEAEALASYREWQDPLEHLGLMQERRALVAWPRDLRGALRDRTLELSFELPAGQYATAVLREIGSWDNAPAAPQP
jgi:tRNA pseudouridine13 synthase